MVEFAATGDHRVAAQRSVTGRVVAILQAVASVPDTSLTQVARQVGLPRCTTHRLLAAIAAGHLVERSKTGRYRLARESGRTLARSGRSPSAGR
jgi:DNA-binding IclR family transcriptional regulator